MRVTRRSLFESDALQIGLFEARPLSDACGDVEWQKSNVVVLPFSRVFQSTTRPAAPSLARQATLSSSPRTRPTELSRRYR
jgi:hypothetical protein